jgi:RNA polymerase sigma-70 factor, ECF subfamily
MLALAGTIPRNLAGIDADAIARAKTGDVEAFERLYRTHVGRVHALVRRLAGNDRRNGPEELVQDVFVRAFEKLHTFRGESAFSTWLYRLAVNVVIETKRSEIRREARLSSEDALAELPERSGQRAPATAVDLERAIAALPDGARTVLVLFDIEGYTHDEIALLLEVTPGTSKSQLHRARRLMREALEK